MCLSGKVVPVAFFSRAGQKAGYVFSSLGNSLSIVPELYRYFVGEVSMEEWLFPSYCHRKGIFLDKNILIRREKYGNTRSALSNACDMWERIFL